MELYLIILIILASILLLFIIFWLACGLYAYNILMICKKRPNIDEIEEDSHWFVFKEELLKRRKEYQEYEKNQEELTLKNKRGINLKGYLIKQDKSERPKLCIFVHGYKSCHEVEILHVNSWMLKKGYDTLLIDQEGLGNSEGKRMGLGILDSENLLEWIDYMNNIYNHNVDIILAGVSMGANTVLLDANLELENVKCIIADCGYTSCYDEFMYLLKGNKLIVNCFRTFLKLIWHRDIKTSTLKTVANSKYPILFIHGNLDRFVPTFFSKMNYDACTSKKDLLLIDCALHAESNLVDTEKYEKKIDSFLKEIF